MTEKEFLDKITANKDCPSYSYSSLLALELAKQQGAKFDIEPVELPRLKMAQRSSTNNYGYLILTDRDVCPSREQANEIIRRCEAWKEIRVLVDCIGDDDPETDRLRRMELIAILDGKGKTK